MDRNLLTRGQMALLRADAPDDAVAAMVEAQWSGPKALALEFLAASVDNARFLVLFGKTGTGKTVAACLVLSEILRRIDASSRPSGGDAQRVPPGLFVRANTLARLSAYDAADREWLESAIRTPCLVLDDLGSEAANDIFKAQLYELLDRRYARSRRTIITSNLDKATFAKRYGERISDRLREKGMSGEFIGESLRKRRSEVVA